jgi:type II secretory ATPase GspE/PulE/Tfp pilus assembly ATPase PilB-like protein
MIMEKKETQLIEEGALSEGFKRMEQDGVTKALNGLTTLEEVERVVM